MQCQSPMGIYKSMLVYILGQLPFKNIWCTRLYTSQVLSVCRSDTMSVKYTKSTNHQLCRRAEGLQIPVPYTTPGRRRRHLDSVGPRESTRARRLDSCSSSSRKSRGPFCPALAFKKVSAAQLTYSLYSSFLLAFCRIPRPAKTSATSRTAMSSPQQRLNSVANQLSPASAARQRILAKNPDDVVWINSLVIHSSAGSPN